jgi:V8-like Glu-specific endopeptidase
MTRSTVLSVLALCLLASVAAADEGMWTLDNFPSDQVQARYGAEIDSEWLETVQLSTVRLGGCTGSFVSPNGLVLTNHHCARRCVSDLSTAEEDLTAAGFLARSRGDEPRCASQTVSILAAVEEITEKVAAETAGKDEQQANEARKQLLSRLEKECQEASSGELHCEAESLYNGGQYFLYKYKRFDDVRLVFAPEDSIAAFGGDPDNFNFPRWCLDMAMLRVYENDEPLSSPNYLTWRREGAAKGEPVFVPGHPGSTDRLLTVPELEFQRDVQLPLWLLRYSELRGRLIQYGASGEEPYRTIQTPLLGIENAIKVRRNHLKALLDDELMTLKRTREAELKAKVAADPELASAYSGAWDEIADAMTAYRTFYEEYLFLEQSAAFNGQLFDYARDLIRVARERQKPNEKRLREYRDTALPRLEQLLMAPRPVYPELETVRLAFSLDKMREWLGPDSPYVKKVLGSDSPAQKAQALVAGTQLADPELRRELWEGGWEAISASDDPMIALALTIDDDSLALRRRYEDEVEAIVDAASERIARARFAIHGTSTYPDATFTLRVTYGAVEGWMEKGEMVEPFTKTARLFERTTGDDPFRLPASWTAAQEALDPETSFNLVATTDITGGNSGSPLVDKDTNIVGLVFDGNIHSTAGDFWFDPRMNRTVAVHPAIMLEALEKVYGATELLEELRQEPRVEAVTMDTSP